MRGGGILGTIVFVWLIIGVVATWQRGYFKGQETSCAFNGNRCCDSDCRTIELRGRQPEGKGLPRSAAAAAQFNEFN